MSEKKFLDHMYIIIEDLKFNFQETDSSEEMLLKAREIFAHKKYSEKVLNYFQNIDYLNVENLNKINKLLKENKEQASIKKINKEHFQLLMIHYRSMYIDTKKKFLQKKIEFLKSFNLFNCSLYQAFNYSAVNYSSSY